MFTITGIKPTNYLTNSVWLAENAEICCKYFRTHTLIGHWLLVFKCLASNYDDFASAQLCAPYGSTQNERTGIGFKTHLI